MNYKIINSLTQWSYTLILWTHNDVILLFWSYTHKTVFLIEFPMQESIILPCHQKYEVSWFIIWTQSLSRSCHMLETILSTIEVLAYLARLTLRTPLCFGVVILSQSTKWNSWLLVPCQIKSLVNLPMRLKIA